MKQQCRNNNNLMPKVYEIWPTRTRFCCGCCITGPAKDWFGQGYIWCCSLSILIPFCIFVAQQNYHAAPALLIVFFVSVLAMFFLLYLTACTDPGIIPRRAFLERAPESNSRFLIPPATGEPRICESCHIIRPWKASHCSACQNCVQVFDHHCGIIGTCIAKRNYRYFIMFLGSVVTSIALCIINMIVFIIAKSSNSINQTVVIVIVSIVAALLGIPLIGFFVFHIYLACTKKTTRELLKNIESKPEEEIQNQWCDVDPSNINFFEELTEEEAERIRQQLQSAQKPLVASRPTLPPINPTRGEQRPSLESQNPFAP